jgi:hypothetical protein
MKKLKALLIGSAFAVTITFSASVATSAQDSMMKQVGDTTKSVAKKTVSGTKMGARKTVSGTKTVYKNGKRVGYTVGDRTWDGSRWVAAKSYNGGRWVARKSVNGTKWVYYKARGTAKKRL